jgi:hypothetical protein
MSALIEAMELLRTTEKELRALIDKALQGGQYGEVAQVASLAERLKALTHSPPSHTTAPSRVRKVRVKIKQPKAGEYPKFFRDSDKLVKLGWSRKKASEYEHRAPLRVAELLLSSIRKKVSDGESFAATDVLPLGSASEHIPEFQGYVALRWFFTEGLVTKLGRDRYSLSTKRLGTEGLAGLWGRLPIYGRRGN